MLFCITLMIMIKTKISMKMKRFVWTRKKKIESNGIYHSYLITVAIWRGGFDNISAWLQKKESLYEPGAIRHWVATSSSVVSDTRKKTGI
jgi:hypothetical protein